MRQIRRSGLATLMVTSGAIALSTGAAHADSGAQGAAVGSPGVVSGNTVQLPVHVPVNVCGNTVNVVGVLNPASGNSCANRSAGQDGYGSEDGGSGSHKDLPSSPRGGEQDGSNGGGSNGGSNGGGSSADGRAEGSPGVISGNGIQLPVHLPVNLSGNSVNVVGIGNPVTGNTSVNGPLQPGTPGEQPKPQVPGKATPPPDADADDDETVPGPRTSSVSLASTGSSELIGYAVPASAALLLGGALLYRRSRRSRDAGSEL